MEIPELLIIEGGAHASDGGSIYIGTHDTAGAAHAVMLWQHMFTEEPDPRRLPGRLYLDGALVPVRSDAERQLLRALRGARLEVPGAGRTEPRGPGMIVGRDLQAYAAAIEQGPEAAVAHLVAALLEFVESEAYVELARRLGGAPEGAGRGSG